MDILVEEADDTDDAANMIAASAGHDLKPPVTSTAQPVDRHAHGSFEHQAAGESDAVGSTLLTVVFLAAALKHLIEHGRKKKR